MPEKSRVAAALRAPVPAGSSAELAAGTRATIAAADMMDEAKSCRQCMPISFRPSASGLGQERRTKASPAFDGGPHNNTGAQTSMSLAAGTKAAAHGGFRHVPLGSLDKMLHQPRE